jgi:hypothetical protein
LFVRGDADVRTLILDPLIPQPLWVALTLISLGAICAYLFWRPPRISRLRRAAAGLLLLIAVGSILTLLLNPTWEELNRAEIGRPSLAVVLDVSGSMGTQDCDGGAKRIDAAKAVVRELSVALQDQFNVRLWSFDKDLRAVRAEELNALQATGVATEIGLNLRHVLQQTNLGEEAAVVLLSDGIHNVPDTLSEVWKAAQTARTMGVPVFTRTFGGDASIANLALQVVTPDDIAYTGQVVPIRARVLHPGFPAGTTTEIALSSEGKILATQPIVFTDEESALVEFPVKAGPVGIQRFTLEVKPLPQQIVRVNNSGVFYLRVIDTPIRVLVLEGKPYWDTKFLVRDLVESLGVTVKSAVRLKDGRVLTRRSEWKGPAKNPDPTPSAEAKPAAEPEESIEMLSAPAELLKSFETLKEYDVIILGRDVDSFLDRDSVENLCRWVGEWGGSLVCARGRPLQVVPASLDRVMPVRWQTGMERRFRVNLTRDAEWGFPAFPPAAPLMPSLASDAGSIVEKPLATVLARSGPPSASASNEPSATPDETKNPMAVASYQPYGSGRVIVFEGSGLWRWAFLPRGETARQEIYPRFWNSLLRWLVASGDFLPGETARLRASQTTFTEMDSPSLFLMTRNDPEIGVENSAPTVEICSLTDPKGFPPRKVACVPAGASENLYRATCGPLPVGAYMAQLERARGGGSFAPTASHSNGPSPRSVECAFDVTEPAAELLDLRARPGLMKQLAEQSGGAVLGDHAAERVRKTYLEYWKERHPEEFHREPAWDRTGCLVALAAVAGALWIVRRRGGLI